MPTITIYSSMATKLMPSYYAMAQNLGAALAHAGYGICYGGTNKGLMGAVADGALHQGGRVLGVLPNVEKLMPLRHLGCTELRLVNNMHERKQVMFDVGAAYVALPGGYGTLEEVFEVLTWRKLGLHTRPLYFMNHENYWGKLVALIDDFIAAGTMNPEHKNYYVVVNSVPELMARLPHDLAA